ncbi:Chs5p-Arf1p-binding proteins-domain-containing protein [Mycotypha africana]|uniref:Chs5p-Arf1p-binding proteins-domain-containing protein n=1 Tax=Mycotypha africana TaxID=64632 RepID=UPI0023010293|nr:Chs5p-Arf1p-binding proteins-domain-containing protein [Mycotypha africana]KAI8967706.1 Chs5p-Arf1p-binding proteins-domain-containing protein [Mycotypha africana]
MGDILKDVPEFFESELGESIAARTDALGTFRELGPPDLCHIIKAHPKPGTKELGSYHYVSGVDASSSATLAAYLNSLTYSLDETQSWFSKSNAWRIRSGIYCCFNAVSRVDVRVEVKIPGGVESYYVDVRGERHEATSSIWQETYLSAVLRAILYSDDSYYRLAGYRKLDPITSLAGEQKFLEAVETLFWKSWQLGSNPEIQTATTVHNHLTSGVMKYFGDSFRYGPAIELFTKLHKKDPEVGALLADSYIGQNEETKAIRVLNEDLKKTPMSYPLLHIQVDFLRSKGEYQMALKLAKFAVNTTPSEFLTWAKLTEVYIDVGDYKNALLTLNSCPMFTYSERDMHRMPAPIKTHLPIKTDIINSGIMEEDAAGRENEADPNLARLPAPALHGTFAKAYALLTRLVSKIGWDDLLRCRSEVFVMEEEYRLQKAKEDNQKSSTSINGTNDEHEDDQLAEAATQKSDRNKDTDNHPLPMPDEETSRKIEEDKDHKSDEEKSELEENEHTITENTSNQEEMNGVKNDENELADQMDSIDLDTEEKENGNNDKNVGKEDEPRSIELQHTPVSRPTQAAAEESSSAAADKSETSHTVSKSSGKNNSNNNNSTRIDTPNPSDGVNFSFSNKRLCERWLDNLFMVLYEDLRIYTFWRTEVAHYRAQQMPYRKTGTEWELLGDLAQRLWHAPEAKEAYEQCLDQKFSAKAWMKLLEIYVKESNVQRALLAAVKLTVYHERWYHEIVYPSEIARHLNVLVRREGLSKMQNILTSMNLPRPVQKLMTRYFDYAELFKVEGYEF